MSRLCFETGCIRKREYRAGKHNLILPSELEPEELYLGMFALKSTALRLKATKLLCRVMSFSEDEQSGLARVDFIIHSLHNKPKLDATGLYDYESGYLDKESLEVSLIDRNPLDSSVELLPPVAGQYFKRYPPGYDESELQQMIKTAN